MAITIGINGFGRIGRNVLRAIFENNKFNNIKIVKINSPSPLSGNAHLFKYDSIHGTFNGNITECNNGLNINNQYIEFSHERDINKLKWEVDIVFECSGIFNNRKDAAMHLVNGAKKVLVSSPCKNADFTAIYGVNHQYLSKEHEIISIGSCTTNCLAPIAKIIHDEFSIEAGFMTTIHSYTNDQQIVDSSHSDLRRARACSISMIPTTTGAAKSIGYIIPELNSILDGAAIRVPTANVSMIDLSFTTKIDLSTEKINNLLENKSKIEYKDIVSVATAQLVSVDFNHNSNSAIFDPFETRVVKNNFARVVAWYDNEWGFSNRMLDVALQIKI